MLKQYNGLNKNFFSDLEMGFWGMPHAPPPPRNFFKMVRFGVHLDQISSLKNFKNYHFLYKFFFKLLFLCKKIKKDHF